jgi:uncharacterized protein
LFLDKTCVHCFEQDGEYLVVDGNSGAVHALDEPAYQVVKQILADSAVQTTEHAEAILWSSPEEEEAAAEILELVSEGLLFTPDLTEVPPRQQTVVKALCLNIAHDCNMRCDYCFAGTGHFGGEREMMSLETAKQAVDFLINASQHRKNCEIDFFGGEPLLNWEVIKDTVAYARRREEETGKQFRFTITTNGIGLTPEIMEFINAHMYNVVLSIDGRQAINDRVRRTISGNGSVYEIIVPKYQEMRRRRKGKSYYVRGTFTSFNLDFASDVAHLNDLGFDEISMEPVVAEPGAPYEIKEEHLPQILAEYERLAQLYLERQQEGRGFNFFHFNVELKKGPCLYKRLSGCGAGFEYLAVSPKGELYPCHQFVGRDEFRLGDVWNGLQDKSLSDTLKDSHVLNKQVCRTCWAKYYCSGGCHANNLFHADSFTEPYSITCEMEKKRLECAFFIQARSN